MPQTTNLRMDTSNSLMDNLKPGTKIDATMMPTTASENSSWYQFPEMNNMMDAFSFGCSLAVIFGGLVPYIPQYMTIKRTMNSEGFSTYVCLTLLIANILRILFWFGHEFEAPLLIQSFIMIGGMLAMMELCVRAKNKHSLTPSHRSRHFLGKSSVMTSETDPIYSVSSGSIQERPEPNIEPPLSPITSVAYSSSSSNYSYFDVNYFWQWTDFLSYIEFLATFTFLAALVTYLLIDKSIYVEGLGFMAVFAESLLGMPQLVKNYTKKSTRGMSVEMVIMWLSGDIFKTTYFLIRHTPPQFWICGTIQVTVDILILLQAFFYKSSGATYQKLPKIY